MIQIDPRADADIFFTKLSQARDCALMLDYDGTLAPFRIGRDRAFPYPGVQEALREITALGNSRLVIVTGRPAKDVTPLLGLEHRPEIWGCHGWERLSPDGTYRKMEVNQQALEGLVLAYGSVLALASGSLRCKLAIDRQVEQKPVGLALHWRGCAPQVVGELRDSLTREWAWLAHESGLKLCEFEEGMELRVSDRTKADTVETIIEETGEDAAVAYLGDGLTDEDAFRALKGKGLSALVCSEVRPSAADLWIRPPDGLLEFLWLWEDLRS
ncbi:MAG: trehalose-phosphatase [Gammaproteobacteria bacterium]